MTTLRVRELAQEQGWNITKLSRKAEITYPTAMSLWHDEAQLLSRKTLNRVALALGVRVADLFEGEPTLEDVATTEQPKTLDEQQEGARTEGLVAT